MATSAAQRLQEERKLWRKDHPPGFIAKPLIRPDGSADMFKWHCKIPGKDNTYCEGAMFPCTIVFSPEYPHKPPTAFMPKGFFHVNVFDSGAICLSVLKEEIPSHLPDVTAWRPNMTVKTILVAIQELLHTPNFGSVANPEAAKVRHKSEKEYIARSKTQAQRYQAVLEED